MGKDQQIIQIDHSEINFYELISIIIKKRKIIAIVTVIFGILGYFINANFFKSDQFTAELYFNPLSNDKISDYKAFNTIQSVTYNNLKKNLSYNYFDKDRDLFIEDNYEDLFIKIDEKLLLSLFISKFNSSNILFESFKDTNLLKIENFISEIDYYSSLKKEINNIKLINDKDEIFNTWKISYKGVNKDAFLKGLELSIKRINQEIKETLKNQFEDLNFTFNTLIDIEIKKLKDDISLKKTEENIKNKKRIEYLSEQSEIARYLNIDTLIDNELILLENQKSEKDYYRGYLVLDKEIEIIKNKIKTAPLNDNFPEITTLINVLKNYKDNNFLNEAYRNSPLFENEFHSVNIDTDLTKINYDKNKSIQIVLLFALAGFAFSSIITLFNHGYKNNFNFKD